MTKHRSPSAHSLVLEAEAARLEGIYFNRGGPCGNDAATCAAALFEAIRLHCAHRKPIPAWVGHELLDAYDRYQEGREPSLGAALGVKRPTKAVREARRFDKWTGLSAAARIVLEVNGRHHDYGRAIGKELFAAVGRSLPAPLEPSKVERIYYASRINADVIAELAAYLERATQGFPEKAAAVAAYLELPKAKGRRKA